MEDGENRAWGMGHWRGSRRTSRTAEVGLGGPCWTGEAGKLGRGAGWDASDRGTLEAGQGSEWWGRTRVRAILGPYPPPSPVSAYLMTSSPRCVSPCHSVQSAIYTTLCDHSCLTHRPKPQWAVAAISSVPRTTLDWTRPYRTKPRRGLPDSIDPARQLEREHLNPILPTCVNTASPRKD
jgi:hypothetical protein